ncbi:CAP domain-containing protein [Streptomyces sp. NPDC051940]|uniref:CAP domain-containing protein n=1 Tax=Streptomyces sp. NPDC051940 TaxID=3155675 RepID=UPI003449C5EC
MTRLAVRAATAALATAAALFAAPPVQADVARPPLPDATDEAFNEACLTAHNAYRARHGALPLVLDDAAVAHARRRAADASTVEGPGAVPGSRAGYGENRYWSASYEDEAAACAAAVDLWYDGVAHYDWANPGFTRGAGTFTQLVWKSSRKLGCARAAGRAPGAEWHETYVVCAYSPAGNITGRFPANVAAPTP